MKSPEDVYDSRRVSLAHFGTTRPDILDTGISQYVQVIPRLIHAALALTYVTL